MEKTPSRRCRGQICFDTKPVRSWVQTLAAPRMLYCSRGRAIPRQAEQPKRTQTSEVGTSAQVSNLLGGVSLDDEMLNVHVLPKLQKEDIMLDFVHIDEHHGGGAAVNGANGTALMAPNDSLAVIDKVLTE